MKKVFAPKIELFSPFAKPFTEDNTEQATYVMIAPEVLKYMQSDNTKIVAKCTPCQCCACR